MAKSRDCFADRTLELKGAHCRTKGICYKHRGIDGNKKLHNFVF